MSSTAQLLSLHTATRKLTTVQASGRLLAGTDMEGKYYVAAPVDYVSWTQEVADFARREDLVSKRPTLLLSGTFSPLAAQLFTALGWTQLQL